MNQPQALRIVVASPTDVEPERDRLERIVSELNRTTARGFGFQLELTRWEKDTYPGFHPSGPQGLIDAILRIPECDLFVGIYWTRFGTAIATSGSGTEHEFRQAYESWQHRGHPQILFYFKTKPPPGTPGSKDLDQWAQVVEFKETFPSEGFYWNFKTAPEFERLVREHLTHIMIDLRQPSAQTRTSAREGDEPVQPEPSSRKDYSGLDFEDILESPDEEELFSVAFAPDGSVAAGSDKKVFLWDRGNPKKPRILEHGGYVYSVAFSLDGDWVACGGEDGTVRVYHTGDGRLRWTPRSHGEAVYSVAFSRDGLLLASGGYDRRVNLWDARTGRLRGHLPREGRVTSVAFSPTQPLVAIGDLNDTVTLWELSESGQSRDVHSLGGHGSSVETVAFSPNGKLVASAGLDKVVRVYNVETKKQEWEGRGHEYLVRSVAFSPDGLTLASASWDKTIRLWDAESGDFLYELPWDELKQEHRWHTDWIWSVAFSGNGMLLATGGSDGKIVLLSLAEPPAQADDSPSRVEKPAPTRR